jgi:elongation factor Ts
MTVTASMVKELRTRSGAGMMECKKALVETAGDIEAAISHLRKSGAAKAAKKAGRIAAEGKILILADTNKSFLLEVNSETDFVGKDTNFTSFCEMVGATLLIESPDTVDELLASITSSGETLEDRRLELISTVGENISVRRFASIEKSLGLIESYAHGDRIGVLLELEGGSPELARSIAMHVAASNPLCILESDLDSAVLDKEKSIFLAQAKESGKPDNIIEKMVEGRMRKFKSEVTLNGQAYVKDPEQTVGELLSANKARVISFKRFELGEGVEKKQENFAEEVQAQAQSAVKN